MHSVSFRPRCKLVKFQYACNPSTFLLNQSQAMYNEVISVINTLYQMDAECEGGEEWHYA